MQKSSSIKVKQREVLEVLKESLTDHPKDLCAENGVRYKLIIDSSDDGSLVRLLFSIGVLNRRSTRIHACSKFLGDTSTDTAKVHQTIVYISCVQVSI